MSRPALSRVISDMDREIELALVGRLRDGDPEAFDAIHAAFNARLFTFLLRLSRRRDVAEDLLEEMWLRLVKHAPRLRPDTRLAPWLFTVARHLHVSYLRSRMLEDSVSASVLAIWPFSPIASVASSPFEAAAASELHRRIERGLASLPATSREVLLLVAIGGLNHADAAEACGISQEALRQRLSRARAQLARAIDGDGGSGAVRLSEVTP
jgi:RNA polymerase sigma-70 factor (ECF subfamily)